MTRLGRADAQAVAAVVRTAPRPGLNQHRPERRRAQFSPRQRLSDPGIGLVIEHDHQLLAAHAARLAGSAALATPAVALDARSTEPPVVFETIAQHADTSQVIK